jgi:hypothetical protein
MATTYSSNSDHHRHQTHPSDPPKIAISVKVILPIGTANDYHTTTTTHCNVVVNVSKAKTRRLLFQNIRSKVHYHLAQQYGPGFVLDGTGWVKLMNPDGTAQMPQAMDDPGSRRERQPRPRLPPPKSAVRQQKEEIDALMTSLSGLQVHDAPVKTVVIEKRRRDEETEHVGTEKPSTEGRNKEEPETIPFKRVEMTNSIDDEASQDAFMPILDRSFIPLKYGHDGTYEVWLAKNKSSPQPLRIEMVLLAKPKQNPITSGMVVQ